MKRISIALTLSCALAAATLGAAPDQDKPKDPKLGTRVTIRGCLHDGQGHNKFVMLGLTERPGVLPAEATNVITPATPMAPGPKPSAPLVPIYWLTSVDGLKERVGHVIDITGIVEEKKTKTGTITVSLDPDEQMTDVKLASGSRDVKADAFPTGRASGAANTTVVTRPSYYLSVERVHSVSQPVNGVPCK